LDVNPSYEIYSMPAAFYSGGRKIREPKRDPVVGQFGFLVRETISQKSN